MSNKIIIAIDGFSSCGKSTLAKSLATSLSYVFIDTGAMYRAIALYFLRNNIDFNHQEAINNALGNIKLHFEFNAATGKSDMYLNNENVELLIREMYVSSKVSEVAAIPAVRDFAVAQQQEMGLLKGIVMDGRDIGTVVFPNAELKIFVTAATDIRIERRFLELAAKDPNITRAAVAENLAHRDLIDSTREHSPLRQAEDALVLDNSNLNQQEQFELALGWAKERIN
jgi:cytidylate kinase